MNDLIAGIVTVEHAGQKLTSDEAAALELKFNELLVDIRGSRNIEAASSHLAGCKKFIQSRRLSQTICKHESSCRRNLEKPHIHIGIQSNI